MERKEKIERAYNEIVAKGIFDIEEGNKPINLSDELSEIPEKMYKHINRGGKGCCFVFSAYLMKVLHDEKISSAMVTTKEGSGIRASVMYRDNEKIYIANPVADIEEFTEKDTPSVIRNFILNSSENKYKNSRIPIQEFADEFGEVSLLGDLYSSEITLGEAMSRQEVIAKPSYTLEQFVKESRPSLYCEQRPEVTCIDGYKFSVQASEFHYSEPRMDSLEEYSAFEVRGITENVIEELQGLEEDSISERPVYPFIPSDKIKEIIKNHGGLNKRVIQEAIRELKKCYESQNTELDRTIKEISGGNEYIANILRYATRKTRLHQEKQKLEKTTQQNNGGNNDGQK